MTKKTSGLLSELADSLKEKRALMLVGASGTGKTFLAKETSYRIVKSEEQNVEQICCHSGIGYDDIVGGVSVNTDDGSIGFDYKDRILIRTIRKACKNTSENYVLIVDDIQKCDLSDAFGEAIECIGNPGGHVSLNNGEQISVPSNFYLIATYNPTDVGGSQLEPKILSHFFVREVLSDISYITDDDNSESAIWYSRIKNLFIKNLDMQYRFSTYEQRRYLPGQGYFSGNNVACRMRYQVLPLLNQYVADGILDKQAKDDIERYYRLSESVGTMQASNQKVITDYKMGITPRQFLDEDKTSAPLENIIGRIVEQGLIFDEEIAETLLFNDCICYREMENDGVTYHGELIADETTYDHMRRRTGDHRAYYNAGTISYKGDTYHFTGGMQPKEYSRDKDGELKRRVPHKIGESTSPNMLLYRIILFYYDRLKSDIESYIRDNPNDKNKVSMKQCISEEFNDFSARFDSIEPQDVDDNLKGRERANAQGIENGKANAKVRQLISELKILWSNAGDTITVNGTTCKLEGVGRLDMNTTVFDEYENAMNELDIHQMILQGPPGTSKTYSAKEFLKYRANASSEDELEEMHITDYSSDHCFNEAIRNTGKTPLAWDIVQFHPSYGYEDFIRGIKVSTDSDSNIRYVTVNKILGQIADMASKNSDVNFYLIIDEINRANLATVFGELIYGLEYRDEAVSTPYEVDNSSKIKIPENLYIIGTMNTADKSIGGIDYAIRRRFLFFEQLPEKSVISDYNIKGISSDASQKNINKKAVVLFENVERLFGEDYLSPEYRKEDVQIGHTYFLVSSENELRMRFEYQIVPLLKEYYRDGIIGFEPTNGERGFDGLLGCISGQLDMASDKKKIDTIFDDLTALQSEEDQVNE